MQLQKSKFSKIFWGSMPLISLEPSSFFTLLQINSAGKIFKNVEI